MHYNFSPVLSLANTNYKLKNMKIKASECKQRSHDPANMADLSLQASGPQPGAKAPSSLFIEFSDFHLQQKPRIFNKN